jgi:hypothetical protein
MTKQFLGLRHRFGGVEHTGWLPPNAAKPLPTPIRDVTVDLFIEQEGPGFLLIVSCAEDGRISSDTWFDRLADAVEAAEQEFGVRPEQWRDT